MNEIGITVKKKENFSEWYTQVVLKAGLADYASTKGFVVLRPYGFSIWNGIRNFVDRKIKALGHQDAYFPSLIPEELLKKEAEHFKGFTPEVYWVTHAGDRKLDERLAVRPTSETIAYSSYSKWIRSWRDLPLLLNFWNSVLRAEIKSTKPFVRTSEFLWQEGHTVHENREDADKEVHTILNIYRDLVENNLAISTLIGKKTEREKFVGALYTTTIESLMPDGKALQMGTSHNLGQNFSKSFNIKFEGQDGKEHYAWQTSWGISWRLMGALIMTHGDDKGLILPPRISPIQVILVPIYYNETDRETVKAKLKSLSRILVRSRVSSHLDDRDEYTPGWKFNEWELKGVPLRIEIGPRDIRQGKVTMVRRDTSEKIVVDEDTMVYNVKIILKKIQRNLHETSKRHLDDHLSNLKDYSEFNKILDTKPGIIKAGWCQNQKCEDSIKEETGADIRLIPLKDEKPISNCLYCDEKAKVMAYFGRAY